MTDRIFFFFLQCSQMHSAQMYTHTRRICNHAHMQIARVTCEKSRRGPDGAMRHVVNSKNNFVEESPRPFPLLSPPPHPCKCRFIPRVRQASGNERIASRNKNYRRISRSSLDDRFAEAKDACPPPTEQEMSRAFTSHKASRASHDPLPTRPRRRPSFRSFPFLHGRLATLRPG